MLYMVLMHAGCGVPIVAEDYSTYELCPGWPDKFYVTGTLYWLFIFVVIFSFFFPAQMHDVLDKIFCLVKDIC